MNAMLYSCMRSRKTEKVFSYNRSKREFLMSSSFKWCISSFYWISNEFHCNSYLSVRIFLLFYL